MIPLRPLTKEIFYKIVDFCSEENWRLYLDEIPSVYPSTKTIDKLLLEEESEILEFKSSMLHPHKPTDKINALENQLSKTSSLKKEELIKKLQEAKNEQSRLIFRGNHHCYYIFFEFSWWNFSYWNRR